MSRAVPGTSNPPLFFQAEDGIRGVVVTGVQTCALPIFEQMGDVRGAVVWDLYGGIGDTAVALAERGAQDRKSTRLNSSHGYISYAVFCLKKKKKKEQQSCAHSHHRSK